ncbi:energy transducer TonB [Nodosilinea sp. AN01ver1]|uniref:energy transducer TonB n=1 Tax=Nodosilinea sp. AN01ver1 TaxID=3423362 RepID=UPI003D31FB46
MTTRFAPPDRARPLWQTLLAPMLLVSLGLHGLVLMLPAGSDGEAVIPPPDPEQDSVAITRVPPAGTPESGAAAASTTTTPVPARPSVPIGAARQSQPLSQATAPQPTPQPASRSRSPQPQARPRSQPQPQSPPPQSASDPRPAASSRPASDDPAAATAPTPSAPDASSQPLFDSNLGERLLAHVATVDLPQAQVDQAAESIQNRFAFNAAAVTREAFNANQQRWEAAIRQDGQANLSPEINRTEFSTVYPQRVCLSDVPGDINIGAVVNPDGSWRGEPTLLRSSGYGALDRKAMQEIQNHTFAPADGLKAYVLTVETSVDYGPRPCLDPNPKE